MAPPAVSIVMAAHGAWSWTERALTAIAAHTALPHEVVLVDNASPDGTAARTRERFPAVRVLRNDVNRGFGPASNQGAEAAAAPLVCFLNTDVLVEPGWLEPLAAAVDVARGVGAAVPCVLELDGRVQCAGALLGTDGTVLEYGNGLDPAAHELRFPRAVDFGPGACLLVERDTFRDVGGFDDAYAPAYYEDADLCLALAERGLRTLYVPASRVRHARHGSGERSAAVALSERNRERFVARRGISLVGRPPTLHPPAPARSLCARDAAADGRILALAAVPPDAGSPLGRALLAVLAARPWARVTLAVDADKGGAAWSQRGVEIAVDRECVLAQRRFHYDAVLADEPYAGLAGSQPQAAVHAPPLAPEAIPAALAVGGLAPAGA